nr:hypothetical protein [Sphingomonas glacialis]
MIERIAACLGGGDEHAQILARSLLPDEIVERFGAQRGVDVFGLARGREDAVVGQRMAPKKSAAGTSARRRMVASVPARIFPCSGTMQPFSARRGTT